MSELVELRKVVSEDAVSAPDSGAVVGTEAGATPPEITLQTRDAPLGTSAPIDCGDERAGAFDRDSCCGWLPGLGDHHGNDPGVDEVSFHVFLAVPAIRGQ